MDNTITIQQDGVEVTLRRRTMLSQSKVQSIFNKMAVIYIELAAELEDDAEAVDLALSKYAHLSAQRVGEAKGVILINPSDDLETVVNKSRDWLINTNPSVALQLIKVLDEINATWNEPAMAASVPESSDPKS